MDAPSFLTPSRMGDPRTSMRVYQPRLDSLDIRTPETVFIPGDIDDAVTSIQAEMEQREWDTAFVRSPYKAAPQRIETGSLINERSEEHVRSTLESLCVQLRGSPWPIGDAFVLRERLDLNFCMAPSHHMEHPEIRFFIEGGDVLGWTPDEYTSDRLCSRRYTYLEDTVDKATPPVEAARTVAAAFPEYHWCVDFALTEGGDWYCIEMNFGGVRWDEEAGRWRNMCGYGDAVAHSPSVVHGPAIRHFPTPP